eukprot:TRINITY_DN7582_c0_g1_i1.p1 TRINITY_DN7582_c0_g1~~TRINITY_DN7582_c0_g1_i1.p1  ORF type:complete len:224 (+),score=29.83 TRINITY_DN7582_c0_g1_i1:18-689(+)
MARLLLVIIVVMFIHQALAQNYCSVYDNCDDCLEKNSRCGWCYDDSQEDSGECQIANFLHSDVPYTCKSLRWEWGFCPSKGFGDVNGVPIPVIVILSIFGLFYFFPCIILVIGGIGVGIFVIFANCIHRRNKNAAIAAQSSAPSAPAVIPMQTMTSNNNIQYNDVNPYANQMNDWGDYDNSYEDPYTDQRNTQNYDNTYAVQMSGWGNNPYSEQMQTWDNNNQ